MNLFIEIVQQEHSSQGRRKRRDQQAVIATRHRPRYGSGSIAPKAIGHQPFRVMSKLGWVELYLRDLGQRAHKKRIHSGISARTTALLPITNQPLSFSTGSAPVPP